VKVLLLVFFTIQTVLYAQIPVVHDYQLDLRPTNIHVQLTFTPAEADSIRFIYGSPPFGGQTDLFQGVKNISCEGTCRFKTDSLQRSITVYYTNKTPIKLSYEITDTRKVNNTLSQLFRPIITPEYFYIHGVNLFLTPEFNNKDLKTRISVQWKNKPAMPIFCTFDMDNDARKIINTTLDSALFRFITGATDLAVKRFVNESGINYLVLRATRMPAQTSSALETFYVQYNKIMRDFWMDDRIIQYALVLQPYLNVSKSISGISFGNGFIGKYDKPDSLALGERMGVLAHEIGHYYLSDLKAFSGEKSEGQWFNEGFNDYLTFYNLVRAGLMDADAFEKRFNKILRQFYTSPIRNTPNNKIFENFWKLGDYQRIPYWRGCVYAFYLDNQLRKTTGRQTGIREIGLALKKLVHNRPDYEFTNEEFIQVLSVYLPEQTVQQEFVDFITEGKSIQLSENNLLPEFQIRMAGETPVLKIKNQKHFYRNYQSR
jgi:hypothetical protein